MSYHPTTHPIRRLYGRHGLGAIDQAGTGAMAGEYMTSLTPYNITPVQAQYVPNTIVTAMYAAGFPAGYVRSGWSDMGHVFVTFLPATGWTDTQRRAALTSAIRAAERNIASDAKLLLPGETAPSGASPTTAPPGTPTSVPSITAPSGRISGGTVGQSVPTSSVQSLLISKGYALAGGADNTFGTSTATALKLALSSIGRYVVIGGHVTTYTVSSDNHSIAFSSGTWEALQSAPNAASAGGSTVLPDGTIVTTGGGPDWGAIAPFLIGGGVLVAAGAYFMLKKKPRAKMTVRNGRRGRLKKNSTPHWDRPMAAAGLVSYRYRGRYGWIMIGATDDADALREAQRSTRDPVSRSRLQVWDGSKYVAIKKKPRAKMTVRNSASGRSYGLFKTYSPSKGRMEWHVSTPSGYGTFYKSTSKARARAWAEKHMSGSGISSNPIPHGYSRKTMGKIIGIERRAGKSASQASAIAYSVARKAAHRAGVHPSHLRNTRGGR